MDSMRPGEDYGGGNREEGREYGREEFRYDTIDPGERTRAQGGGGPHWGGLSVLLSLTLAAAATPGMRSLGRLSARVGPWGCRSLRHSDKAPDCGRDSRRPCAASALRHVLIISVFTKGAASGCGVSLEI